jgi:hypothetical protein
MHPNACAGRLRPCMAATLIILLMVASLPTRAVAATPVHWDPRIKPIAAAVERLRGLKFEHTVPVDFLSEAQFKKKVAVDEGKLTKAERAEIERSEHQFRALGLIPTGTNIIKALNSLKTSGALAYYDNRTKRVTVRGTRLTVSTKVTLAHELTHVLQDQHFDLSKLERDAARTNSSTALRTLVEGDAVRIQNAYADELGASDRAVYEKQQAAAASDSFDEIRADGVPDALSVLFQEPYVFGPPMLDLLVAAKNKSAVDGLFRDPPTTDASYLTPTTLVDGTKFKKVATPRLASHEKRSGKAEVFGAFALFLVLASRGNPADALAAADGWGGDSMITFTRDAATCVRVTLVGRTATATTKIGDALSAWAASLSSDTAVIALRAGAVTATACDVGPVAGEPPNSAVGSLVLAATRDELLAETVKEGLQIPVAECAANGLVRDPVFRPLIDAAAKDPNATPDESVLGPLRTRILQLTVECSTSTT